MLQIINVSMANLHDLSGTLKDAARVRKGGNSLYIMLIVQYVFADLSLGGQASSQLGELLYIDEKVQFGFYLQENATSVTKSSDVSDMYESSSVKESLNPPVQTKGIIPKKKTIGSVIPKKKTEGSISSSAATSRNLTPDFSKLRGEICLDKLSIRELHETFRATFGRETTVKDKAWLKRRIAMGLTNSCDVSTTTFLMKDGKIVKLEKEKCTENVDGTSVNNSDAMIRSEHQNVVTVGNSIMEDSQILGKRLRHHDVENESGSEILDQDLKGSKRIRKPTRRYIEELSEVESHERGGRLIASSRSLRHETPRLDVRPIRHISSDSKTFVTRVDSLAGIRVPCVSRVRRSRPRKDILALTVLNNLFCPD